MKTPYSLSLIRYTHDVVSGEFVNVGVVLFAPKLHFASALCSQRLTRVIRMFPGVDRADVHASLQYIERMVHERSDRLAHELALQSAPTDAAALLREIIPFDDSALRVVNGAGGETDDPMETLRSHFARFVESVELEPLPSSRRGRRDDAVWKAFGRELSRRDLLSKLTSHTITAPGIDHTFRQAWKNERWHCYEALSFDLSNAEAIAGKAERWLGRSMGLAHSTEPFTLNFLIGTPSNEAMFDPFERAMTLLAETPVAHRIVHEAEAEAFATQLEHEINAHG